MLPLFARYQAQHDRAFHRALNDLFKIRAERRRQLAARDKGERAKLLLAQRTEYNSFRAKVLRMKINNQAQSKKPLAVSALDIGFVSESLPEPHSPAAIAPKSTLKRPPPTLKTRPEAEGLGLNSERTVVHYGES